MNQAKLSQLQAQATLLQLSHCSSSVSMAHCFSCAGACHTGSHLSSYHTAFPLQAHLIAFLCLGVQALEDQGEDMEAASAAAVASAAASEDLHASLEANLRASRADVGRLQSEVKRLQAAASAASLATDAFRSPPSRDGPFLEEAAQLQSQLEASQTRCSLLQAEVTQLKAAASAAAAATSQQAAAADAASPVSRDGSQTASSSGRSASMRGSLQNGIVHGDTTFA